MLMFMEIKRAWRWLLGSCRRMIVQDSCFDYEIVVVLTIHSDSHEQMKEDMVTLDGVRSSPKRFQINRLSCSAFSSRYLVCYFQKLRVAQTALRRGVESDRSRAASSAGRKIPCLLVANQNNDRQQTSHPSEQRSTRPGLAATHLMA